MDGVFDISKVLVIGDSIWDTRAANAANLRSAAVLTGGFCKVELQESGAERIFKGLKEAYDKFEEIEELVSR